MPLTWTTGTEPVHSEFNPQDVAMFLMILGLANINQYTAPELHFRTWVLQRLHGPIRADGKYLNVDDILAWDGFHTNINTATRAQWLGSVAKNAYDEHRGQHTKEKPSEQ